MKNQAMIEFQGGGAEQKFVLYEITFGEVLITLGVIGVVAAMTLPTVISNYRKKQTVTHLQKVYSVLNQAFKLSQLDNGEYKDWELSVYMDPKEYVSKYWAPYLKTIKICDNFSDCGYSKVRPWIHQDGSVSEEDVSGTIYRHALVLSDGTLITFRIPAIGQPENSPKINIDLNGPKGPNMTGIDYFWLVPSEKGVIPMYSDIYTNDQLEESCKSPSDGVGCLAKIMADGWEIKDDYPWK